MVRSDNGSVCPSGDGRSMGRRWVEVEETSS